MSGTKFLSRTFQVKTRTVAFDDCVVCKKAPRAEPVEQGRSGLGRPVKRSRSTYFGRHKRSGGATIIDRHGRSSCTGLPRARSIHPQV